MVGKEKRMKLKNLEPRVAARTSNTNAVEGNSSDLNTGSRRRK